MMSEEKQIEVVTYERERLDFFTELMQLARTRYNLLYHKFKDASYVSEEHQMLSDMGREVQFFGDVVEMLENGYSKQSEWISVEERLPEEKVAVLIWHGKIDVAKIHKGITKADREKMERGELLDPMEFGWTLGGVVSIPRSKSFKGCDEFGNNHVPYNWVAISGPMEWFGQDVSYWMPLPEPPKGN